jgi:hypothetical protein
VTSPTMVNGETEMQFVQRRVPPVMQAHQAGTLKRKLSRALITALSDLGETDTVRGPMLAARLQLDDAVQEAQRLGDQVTLAALGAAQKVLSDAIRTRWEQAGGGEAFEERRDVPSAPPASVQ